MADWSKITSRGDVEDRRGMSMAVGGIGGLGLVGTLLVLGFTYLTNGHDLGGALQQLQGIPSGTTTQQAFERADIENGADYPAFASTVLGSTDEVWGSIFNRSGRTYQRPKLVLFRQATQSGCGVSTSDVGPHYCPPDQTVYLDETFFDELQTRFQGDAGDVAQAYVIAHEVGHHVQNQLGAIGAQSNEESVRVELQADCYAGVWAHTADQEGVFTPGEVNEALSAAAAVGDDRIQKSQTGRVNPETWTHGSAAQRNAWFTRGYQSGDPNQCDTFAATSL